MHARQKRNCGIDADERRLFPHYGDEEGSKACPIVSMSQRQRSENMNRKTDFPGGFVPRNTLATTLSQQTQERRISKPQSFGSKAPPLDTRASRGDNVERTWVDPTIEANGNRKRQKLTHNDNVLEIGSDELKAEDPRSIRLSHKPLYFKKTVEPPSSTSTKAIGLTTSWTTVHNDSTLPGPLRRTDTFQENSTLAADPIDLSSDVEISENPDPETTSPFFGSPRSGTGLDNQFSTKAANEVSTEHRSKYFPKSLGFEQLPIASTSPRLPKVSKHGKSLDEEDSGLMEKFVDVGGNRRGQQSSSPDALAGGKTIGERGNNILQGPTLPQKTHHHSRSLEKDSRPESRNKVKDASLPECEPSTIPRSIFKSGKRRESNAPPAVSRASMPGESPVPWNTAISAVIFNGHYKEERGLVLIYSTARDEYTIKQNTRDLSAEDPSLKLMPKKLHRVLWEQDGLRVRFESAKSGTTDNRMDIRLSSEKGLWSLKHLLQTQNKELSQKEELSQRMEKMINQRLKERRPETQITTKMPVEESDEIALMKANKARRDSKRDATTSASYDEKRSQMQSDRRIIDRMRGRSKFDRENTVSKHGDKFSTTEQKAIQHGNEVYNHRLSNQTTHDLDRTSDTVSQMPAKFAPAMSNGGHQARISESDISSGQEARVQTRGLRSKVQSEGEALMEMNKTLMKTQKWGKKWSKPLTFPQVGPKKTTVEWDDLDRLEDDEFYNDNLIAFYLRYLEEKLQLERPEIAKKVYFFNSYFFASLTSNGPRSINYNAVKNWTRNVDLLTYDYIIVPINQAYHWYCAVICNLSALRRELGPQDKSFTEAAHDVRAIASEEKISAIDVEGRHTDSEVGNDSRGKLVREIEEDEKETRSSFAELSLDDSTRNISKAPYEESHSRILHPENMADTTRVSQPVRKGKRKSLPPKKTVNPASPAIVTFDSLEMPRFPAIKSLKDYIKAEAQEKRGGMAVDTSLIKGMTAKDIPIQPNATDCGPIMLRYIEKLLENPKDFVSRTLSKELSMEGDWPKAETEGMRDKMALLIKDLNDEQTNLRREEAKRNGIYIDVRQGALSSANVRHSNQEEKPRSSPVPIHQKSKEKSIPHTTADVEGSAVNVNEAKEPLTTPKSASNLESSQETNHDASKTTQSPASDHFAAASQSPSAGEKFLLIPGTNDEPNDICIPAESTTYVTTQLETSDEQECQRNDPNHTESQSQPLQGADKTIYSTVSRPYASALQVMKKRRALESQLQQSHEQIASQQEPRVQVVDSQPQAGQRSNGEFESLFDDEDNLREIDQVDELQDSTLDDHHALMNGPWARGYPAQPASAESSRKRKASQSPVSGSSSLSPPPPPSDTERGHAMQDEEQEAANRQLLGRESEQDQEQEQEKEQRSPNKKRGRKKKKKTKGVMDSERKSSPPVVYELSD